MVREMNRIPLYEALKRKKEAEGLNQTPQAQPVPQQKPRMEPRIQLKPSPTQATQVPSQPKPLTKPVSRPLVTLKGRVLKQPKQPSRSREMLRELLNDKNLLKWAGVAAAIIIVLLLILTIASRFSGGVQDQPEIANGIPAAPKEPLNVNEVDPEKKGSTPVGRERVAQKPSVKQPDVLVAQPVKTQTPAKPEMPLAIQNEFQKPTTEKKLEPVKATLLGDNVIVIVAYTKQSDLVPVQSYFKQNGIETDVIQRGSYYLLVTKNRYENPRSPGTDGYQMIQTIKRLGAKYKAPEGFERFGSAPFQDAYGMKIK